MAGTTYGESTNRNGYYSLTAPTAGYYDLVFSFIGYKRVVRNVRRASVSSVTVNEKMEEKIEELGEMEVKTSNKKCKKQYNQFFEKFIGKSKYRQNVLIENPWLLDFSEEEGLLIATSKRLLIIINKALGYRIYIELVTFKWPKDMYRGGGVSFISQIRAALCFR